VRHLNHIAPAHRPPPLRRRRRRLPRPKHHPVCARLCSLPLRPRDISPQRMQRIVRDQPTPHQAPQRINRLAWEPPVSLRAAANCLVQRIKKARPEDSSTASSFSSRSFSGSGCGLGCASSGIWSARNSAILPSRSPNRLHPRPRHLARRNQRISPPGAYSPIRAGKIPLSTSDAVSGAPCKLSIASSAHPGSPAPRRQHTLPVRKNRASVCCSTGSTSLRSRASDFRLISRSISASHHSR